MRQFINPAPFVLMLLVGSCHLSSDSVQISLSLRHQFAAPILILFHHFQSLQGLKDPLGHALGASAEVAGHDIVPLMPPIDLGHGANPSATLGVLVLCRGSSSCVEPVLIVGSKFFMLGQLDGVHPFRDFQLPGPGTRTARKAQFRSLHSSIPIPFRQHNCTPLGAQCAPEQEKY